MLFEDQNGVLEAWAYFHLVDDSDNVNYGHYIILSGDGEGQTKALIDLTRSTWSVPIVAGEYRCTQVEVLSVSGEHRTYTPEERPDLIELSFRYEYPRGRYANTGGPELVGFVSNAIATLTAPGRTPEELERLARILHEAHQRNASVEEVQETVREETPQLANVTDLLPRTRSELYAFIALILTVIQMVLTTVSAQEINIQDVDIDVEQVIKVTTEQQSPHNP